jgi:hypothetical protein
VSDNHHGLPHDLPEYVPNWPVPVKVKARVYKDTWGWTWTHSCPVTGRALALGYPLTDWAAAFEAALKHARGCW